jgi:hypothetical protein
MVARGGRGARPENSDVDRRLAQPANDEGHGGGGPDGAAGDRGPESGTSPSATAAPSASQSGDLEAGAAGSEEKSAQAPHVPVPNILWSGTHRTVPRGVSTGTVSVNATGRDLRTIDLLCVQRLVRPPRRDDDESSPTDRAQIRSDCSLKCVFPPSGIVSPARQFGTALVNVGGSAGTPSCVSNLKRTLPSEPPVWLGRTAPLSLALADPRREGNNGLRSGR